MHLRHAQSNLIDDDDEDDDDDDDDDDDEKKGFTQQSSFGWKISPNCLQLLLPHTNPGIQSLTPE